MRSTSRIANRLWLLLAGLLLILGGVLLAMLGLYPELALRWLGEAQQWGLGHAPEWWYAEPWPGASWATLIGLALVAVVILLLLVLLWKQGGGKARLVLRDSSSVGELNIATAVVQDLLEDALRSRPEVSAVRVRAYTVKRQEVVQVSVGCRRAAAPQQIRAAVTRAVESLDQVLGAELPVFVELNRG